jgi:hypothetical protein
MSQGVKFCLAYAHGEFNLVMLYSAFEQTKGILHLTLHPCVSAISYIGEFTFENT